ncbi:substrate-binding domain-containing protein [Paenibacillus urinalis]|uniref:Substrate-binding domain-containing protein n=1 Tax=Paenibacillus urinalis TaxID=521520 RepID=A0ABY7XC10_9BACL|nr:MULTISPECIES: substrate-binding domain-containing protein [Paenibacillus]WDH99704.1 substrate-binding domain-containing protein [Paenibacillus urinalis]WDI03336.1 substrate-binding domain-containing protein [Paenibacillus urinalis]
MSDIKKTANQGEPVSSKWGLWFGKSIQICLMYVVLTFFIGGVVGVPAGKLLLHHQVPDLGVFLIAAVYFYLMVTVFVSFGAYVTRDTGAYSRILLLSIIPLLGFALYYWGLGMQLSDGDARELWSSSWMWYSLNLYWANPVLKVLSAYGGGMTVVTLVMALVPSISILLGIVLQRKVKVAVSNRTRILVWGAFPILSVLALLIFIVVPKGSYTVHQYPQIDGATAAIPFAEKLKSELTGVNQLRAADDTRFNTTHQAYLNLIEGRADLIFVAGPSEDEVSTATKNGVELELHPVGKDAFIFLVNDHNPISGLSTEQIQDIYGGFITNWSEVGGRNEPILALQREANSGSQTFMEKGVMVDAVLTEVPKEQKVSLMGGLIDRVAAYNNEENAIGYSFHYYASEMYQKENVKFLAIDDVMPNRDSIRSGEYPYTAELYAVTRSDLPEDHAAREIVEWLQGEEGQEVVEEGGFIAVGDDE